MPPKKGEDEVAQVPYTYMTVLPIVVDSHAAETALRQNVNLKKNIDRGRAM